MMDRGTRSGPFYRWRWRNALPFILHPSYFILVLLLLVGCDTGPRTMPPVEVYFSPRGGCTDAVVREIHAAKATILIQAYSFTSWPITNALVDAHRRGVQVRLILDKKESHDAHCRADVLRHDGVAVTTDGIHTIAHNKVMVIDDAVVITGSFNFTWQAEHGNAENLAIIRDPSVAAQYSANWREHAAHSE